MPKQIWKYPIDNPSKTTFSMPLGAEILTIQVQRGTPCVWAVVDPTKAKEERIFEIFGTGHDMIEPTDFVRNYIQTFQMNGGDLVFHLFEQVYN